MQYISGKRARSLVEHKRAILVDTRGPVEFRNGSLPSARNLPLRNLINELLLMKSKGKVGTLIIFGSENDNVLSIASTYSEEMGFTVYALKSMNDWFEK